MAPKKAPAASLPIHAFPSAADFSSFLATHHSTLPGIQLKLAKKSSGIPTISGAEAIEVALCYGWIDGQASPFDDQYWLIRYTPRRAKSIWSQKNVATVARLTSEGRMQPAGVAAAEAAKRDGRWEKAYAGPATMVAPDDLNEALAAQPAAKAFWDGLNRSQRYGVMHKVANLAAANRAKCIRSYVETLTMGRVPGAKALGDPVPSKPARVTKEVSRRRASSRTKTGTGGLRK